MTNEKLQRESKYYMADWNGQKKRVNEQGRVRSGQAFPGESAEWQDR